MYIQYFMSHASKNYKPDAYARNFKLHPIDTDSPSFTIEEIVESKTIRAVLHYLVKREDSTSDYNSWEPHRNLIFTPGLLDLINKFHRVRNDQHSHINHATTSFLRGEVLLPPHS